MARAILTWGWKRRLEVAKKLWRKATITYLRKICWKDKVRLQRIVLINHYPSAFGVLNFFIECLAGPRCGIFVSLFTKVCSTASLWHESKLWHVGKQTDIHSTRPLRAQDPIIKVWIRKWKLRRNYVILCLLPENYYCQNFLESISDKLTWFKKNNA